MTKKEYIEESMKYTVTMRMLFEYFVNHPKIRNTTLSTIPFSTFTKLMNVFFDSIIHGKDELVVIMKSNVKLYYYSKFNIIEVYNKDKKLIGIF